MNRFIRFILTHRKTLEKINVDIEHRLHDYARYYKEWKNKSENYDEKIATARATAGLEIGIELSEITIDDMRDYFYYEAGFVPSEIEGLMGPFPVAEADINMPELLKSIITISSYVEHLAVAAAKSAKTGAEMEQEVWNVELEKLLTNNEYLDELRWNTYDTQLELFDQYTKRDELMAKVNTYQQMEQNINSILASGELLLTERGEVRARAAQRIQSGRYADLTFRIFRDDALRRYKETFDLAARYVYLAAKAYDYETGLLNSDTEQTAGSKFLEDIVRARLPGRFYTWLGTPMAGGTEGEPGLADIMARMKADWDVVEGRFGFNNPDNETSRFSLRTELMRISTNADGDAVWAQALENYRVDDLNELQEYKRYCKPLSSSTNAEPAIVIPFSSCVTAGKNFFGLNLAGGDNAYSPTRAATKIRSVGVWFTGYDTTFNTNTTGSGLAYQPQAYLIPVGIDIMHSPTRNSQALRYWEVLDQALPLPYNIGESDLNDPDWQPLTDSLCEPLAAIRRFSAFRAYHDSGDFDDSETHNNGRLIGRSVWNTRWLLIIPGRTLLADPEEGIERFIHGAETDGQRDGNGIKDIKIFFQTYGIWGE